MLKNEPIWCAKNTHPLMVPSARNPYTSAVSVDVSGTLATHDMPDNSANIINPSIP